MHSTMNKRIEEFTQTATASADDRHLILQTHVQSSFCDVFRTPKIGLIRSLPESLLPRMSPPFSGPDYSVRFT